MGSLLSNLFVYSLNDYDVREKGTSDLEYCHLKCFLVSNYSVCNENEKKRKVRDHNIKFEVLRNRNKEHSFKTFLFKTKYSKP